MLKKHILQILVFYKPTPVRKLMVEELLLRIYSVDLLGTHLMEKLGCVASSKVHLLGL